MLKLIGLFLSVLLILQSKCCANNSDEIQDDEESEVITNSHEVVDSFPRSYNAAQQQYYPYWRQWNFPYYQPRTPQIPFGDGERSPPLADPRFVSNRCNPIQSYTYSTTTYPCTYTTTSYTTSVYTLTTTITTTVTTNTLALRIAETPTSDNHSDDYDAIHATTDYISDISPTTPVSEFA